MSSVVHWEQRHKGCHGVIQTRKQWSSDMTGRSLVLCQLSNGYVREKKQKQSCDLTVVQYSVSTVIILKKEHMSHVSQQTAIREIKYAE